MVNVNPSVVLAIGCWKLLRCCIALLDNASCAIRRIDGFTRCDKCRTINWRAIHQFLEYRKQTVRSRYQKKKKKIWKKKNRPSKISQKDTIIMCTRYVNLSSNHWIIILLKTWKWREQDIKSIRIHLWSLNFNFGNKGVNVQLLRCTNFDRSLRFN